ncbi:hypothetical protein RJ640_012620 [Escallonia rubra]|uniref:WRKY domain-containing protein n=1 Tax=Escallonia rubra TaxID=112253 RepID=A0AA88QZL8_9ASTE|nr:hypothetical protein RJ640_012620 [Escallonia rubra]
MSSEKKTSKLLDVGSDASRHHDAEQTPNLEEEEEGEEERKKEKEEKKEEEEKEKEKKEEKKEKRRNHLCRTAKEKEREKKEKEKEEEEKEKRRKRGRKRRRRINEGTPIKPYQCCSFSFSQDRIGLSHQEALVSVKSLAVEAHLQTENSPAHLTSEPELSPTSVTQSISSSASPTVQQNMLSPLAKCSSTCVAELDQQNYSDVAAVPVTMTHSIEGYSWRKYGQKQVKTPQGSRSYFKCTYSKCSAKKIERFDLTSCITEIIYKGGHNHDPPGKINCTGDNSLALSVVPVEVSNISDPIRTPNHTDQFSPLDEPIEEAPVISETKRQSSCCPDSNAGINVEENFDEPEAKRRQVAEFRLSFFLIWWRWSFDYMFFNFFPSVWKTRTKKSTAASSGPLLNHGKKSKIVVHAVGDVGISGDGYRWRKYGQKMVKGTPHPRNYYKCTSAGCPVRKHIEMARDDATAAIITYKGIHDHDMPVPKKRHGPPSSPLVAAASPASMSNSQSKGTEELQNQKSATQWSVDGEGELTCKSLDLGVGKAMDSTRTLLGIGFEIKPF